MFTCYFCSGQKRVKVGWLITLQDYIYNLQYHTTRNDPGPTLQPAILINKNIVCTEGLMSISLSLIFLICQLSIFQILALYSCHQQISNVAGVSEWMVYLTTRPTQRVISASMLLGRKPISPYPEEEEKIYFL